ncbi:MAG: tRNA (N6-isopentenyl adenosine(37)-C2)-methylthiotransferase MiaB [Epulopiscium sp.]|nr:tRNA (N6-isopentenyl adenosine(37)-C2)-methylthiotransferase MiaB [Candidatus Epulonipiscium sp.]
MSRKERVYKIGEEEALRQKQIIEELSSSFQGKGLSYFIQTFGCQMNVRDSEKLVGILEKLGFSLAVKEKEADFIIYNTCCVRENAEQKVFGRLGSLKSYKEKNPHIKIAICGCMMQQENVLKEIKQKYRHVDLVFGTFNLYKFPELLQTHLETNQMVIDIWKEHQEIVEDLPSIRKDTFKAGVNIMYGCNNFCSYCIVPYVRGRERSRLPEEILAEVQRLVADGVKEIMLLGQNVNSYGKTLEQDYSFPDLLKDLTHIEGLERIRFMTSHPKDLSDELIKVMKESNKICRHLHLPVQAGSTKILKAMNRKYTKEHYLNLVKKIRSAMPNISLTTDIIVGFPGEHENEFQETLDLVQQVKFDGAFTFLYSKRTGTPGATMEDQIPEEKAKKHFNELLSILDSIVYENNLEKKEEILQILVEEANQENQTILTGRSDTNHLVHFAGDSSLVGKIVPVKITDAKPYYLIGELIV